MPLKKAFQKVIFDLMESLFHVLLLNLEWQHDNHRRFTAYLNTRLLLAALR